MQLEEALKQYRNNFTEHLLAKREMPMGVREMLPGSLEAGGSQHPLRGHAYRLFRTD